jgi:hypothetical protein
VLLSKHPNDGIDDGNETPKNEYLYLGYPVMGIDIENGEGTMTGELGDWRVVAGYAPIAWACRP